MTMGNTVTYSEAIEAGYEPYQMSLPVKLGDTIRMQRYPKNRDNGELVMSCFVTLQTDEEVEKLRCRIQ